MIVTLTPNPSIDRAVLIDALRRGEVHRASSSRIDPGGKGVNVSRALAAQGGSTIAVLPSGGPEGHLLEELLDAAGVTYASVPVRGSVRMNISVLEPDGTTTKLNEPGPDLSADEVEALLATTLQCAVGAHGADWVVGCGSLPPGAPTDLYAVLVRRVRERGGRVAIDSSGAPFAAAVAARPQPHQAQPRGARRARRPRPAHPGRRARRGPRARSRRHRRRRRQPRRRRCPARDGRRVRARPGHHHGPPVHRGRRRLHARRPAPRPVHRPRPGGRPHDGA